MKIYNFRVVAARLVSIATASVIKMFVTDEQESIPRYNRKPFTVISLKQNRVCTTPMIDMWYCTECWRFVNTDIRSVVSPLLKKNSEDDLY